MWQGNVFTPVCHSVHRGCVYPKMHWGRHPPGQTYPSMHWGRHIPVCTGADTPTHLPESHCCGLYASYWNAFLSVKRFVLYMYRFLNQINFYLIKFLLVKSLRNFVGGRQLIEFKTKQTKFQKTSNVWNVTVRMNDKCCIYNMSHFAYACKMRYPLNLVLESWKYLWFYWTFCIVILDYGLKLHKLSIHTLVMLQKWLEIH